MLDLSKALLYYRLTQFNDGAMMTATELKSILAASANFANDDEPQDADLRCRLFVAHLSGSIDEQDKVLGAKLRAVYQSTPNATGTPT